MGYKIGYFDGGCGVDLFGRPRQFHVVSVAEHHGVDRNQMGLIVFAMRLHGEVGDAVLSEVDDNIGDLPARSITLIRPASLFKFHSGAAIVVG